MDILNNHCTIRKFRDQAIADELLQSIIYSGVRASTTGNMQLYSVIIHHNGEIKDQLIPLHFNQNVAGSAPVLLTFVADFNRFTNWCSIRNANPGFDNLLSFLNAMTDTLLTAQNVCIAAENSGLGICYLGTTLYNASEIIDLLKLPYLTFPVTAIALGWPDESPEQPDRIPIDGIIHSEVYHPYTEDDITKLFEPKESLSSSLKFVTENSKENLAQVFADTRYKKSDNEYFSEKITRTLIRQGFLKNSLPL
jgi:nitroreductase